MREVRDWAARPSPSGSPLSCSISGRRIAGWLPPDRASKRHAGKTSDRGRVHPAPVERVAVATGDEQRAPGGPAGGGGKRGAAAAWAGWWVASWLLWIALVDNLHPSELITGAAIACVSATAAVGVRQQRLVVLRPRLRWLARLWRP